MLEAILNVNTTPASNSTYKTLYGKVSSYKWKLQGLQQEHWYITIAVFSEFHKKLVSTIFVIADKGTLNGLLLYSGLVG